jgi:hypothetical protein
MAALREENALLKKQLADLKPAAPNAAEAARLKAELAGARKQIAALQSAAEVGFLEKAALENRVRQLQIAAVNSAPVAPPPSQAENEARIRLARAAGGGRGAGHPLHAGGTGFVQAAGAATGQSRRGKKSIRELPGGAARWWPRRKLFFRRAVRQGRG